MDRIKLRRTQRNVSDKFDCSSEDNSFEGSIDVNENRPLSKQEERLQRNREIARNSRKRKRERIETLSEEVSTLREANRKLALKLKMALNKLGEATSGRGNRGKEDEEARLREICCLSEMLEQKTSPEDVLDRLRHYAETYSDFGEERMKLTKVHISSLEQLLLPTQISKMLLWILKQEDAFFADPNPYSLWNMICTELNLNEQQKNEIKAQRGVFGTQNASMKKCLHQLNKFEIEVQKNMELRRHQIHQMMKIISPKQTIKFLQWVENNQVCVHMLNGEWTMNKQRYTSIVDDITKD